MGLFFRLEQQPFKILQNCALDHKAISCRDVDHFLNAVEILLFTFMTVNHKI